MRKLGVFVVLGLALCGPATAGKDSQAEGFLEADGGVRLYHRSSGEGEEAVLVPMASWLAEELAPLAEGRRVVFYDPRGRGRSDAAEPAQVSFENEIADLEAVRRHFGLEKVALMGWSHYGLMTAVYAMRHPERVTRLVQICPAAPRRDPYLRQGMEAMRSRIDALEWKVLGEQIKAGVYAADPAAECRAQWKVTLPAFFGVESAVSRARDVCDLPTEQPAAQNRWWGALFGSLGNWDVRAELPALKAPRLVVAGGKDFIPLEATREWAAGQPQARLLVLEGVGHHPHLERPAAFLEAVERFLDGQWPQGAEPVAAEASGN